MFLQTYATCKSSWAKFAYIKKLSYQPHRKLFANFIAWKKNLFILANKVFTIFKLEKSAPLVLNAFFKVLFCSFVADINLLIFLQRKKTDG